MGLHSRDVYFFGYLIQSRGDNPEGEDYNLILKRLNKTRYTTSKLCEVCPRTGILFLAHIYNIYNCVWWDFFCVIFPPFIMSDSHLVGIWWLGKTQCDISDVQMEFCQIACKQTDALWGLFSSKNSQFS